MGHTPQHAHMAQTQYEAFFGFMTTKLDPLKTISFCSAFYSAFIFSALTLLLPLLGFLLHVSDDVLLYYAPSPPISPSAPPLPISTIFFFLTAIVASAVPLSRIPLRKKEVNAALPKPVSRFKPASISVGSGPLPPTLSHLPPSLPPTASAITILAAINTIPLLPYDRSLDDNDDPSEPRVHPNEDAHGYVPLHTLSLPPAATKAVVLGQKGRSIFTSNHACIVPHPSPQVPRPGIRLGPRPRGLGPHQRSTSSTKEVLNYNQARHAMASKKAWSPPLPCPRPDIMMEINP